MHFFKTLLAGVSALALVAAQGSNLAFTTTFTSIKAGEPVKITWTGGDLTAPVTITLRSGDPNNLNIVTTITSSVTGGSFTWTPPSDLPSLPNYALQITQGSVTNYSNQFMISGGPVPTGTAFPTLIGHSNTTIATTTTSASSASTSSHSTSSNYTTTSSSFSTKTTNTAAKTASAPTGSSTSAPNSNTAAGLASPLALVLSVVMAMIYFN